MYIVYDDLFSKTTSNYVIEDDSATPILLIIAVVKYVKSGKEIPVLQEQVDNFEI